MQKIQTIPPVIAALILLVFQSMALASTIKCSELEDVLQLVRSNFHKIGGISQLQGKTVSIAAASQFSATKDCELNDGLFMIYYKCSFKLPAGMTHDAFLMALDLETQNCYPTARYKAPSRSVKFPNRGGSQYLVGFVEIWLQFRDDRQVLELLAFDAR